MVNLFISHLNSLKWNKDIKELLQERDILMGCNLLHFACKECDYQAIKQIFGACKDTDLATQANNGNTCLHSIVLNRKLSLVLINSFIIVLERKS